MRICLEHLWVLVTRGETGQITEGVSDTWALGRSSGLGWVAAGWQEREEQATEGTQVGDHENFLGSGFRTRVSVVAAFKTLRLRMRAGRDLEGCKEHCKSRFINLRY